MGGIAKKARWLCWSRAVALTMSTPRMGSDKKVVDELVASLLVSDWDLDGDGQLDAVTVAWSFETMSAQATGVE